MPGYLGYPSNAPCLFSVKYMKYMFSTVCTQLHLASVLAFYMYYLNSNMYMHYFIHICIQLFINFFTLLKTVLQQFRDYYQSGLIEGRHCLRVCEDIVILGREVKKLKHVFGSLSKSCVAQHCGIALKVHFIKA